MTRTTTRHNLLMGRQYLLEYAIIHRNHDNSRDPKRYWTWHYSINLVYDENAFVWVLFEPLQMIERRIPAQEDRSEWNQSGKKPHVRYHHPNSLFSHVKWIFERSTNSKISGGRISKTRLDETAFGRQREREFLGLKLIHTCLPRYNRGGECLRWRSKHPSYSKHHTWMDQTATFPTTPQMHWKSSHRVRPTYRPSQAKRRSSL